MKSTSNLFILVFLTCFLNQLSAQEIEWQKTFGGSDYDQLNSMQQTADGGFICAGSSDSDISGDKTENSHGGYDFWVLKLDSSGSIQWQNTIGGNGQDFLNSIQLTNDGGYICGGYSDSNVSGDKSENSKGGTDYWIVKLDSAGNVQWDKTIGGSLWDYMYSIQQTSDGGYICGGMSESNISGDKIENSQGGQDYWVVKLDMNGDIQWQNTIGGNQDDVLMSVNETTDGGFICGGYSLSWNTGDKIETSWGQEDYWIIKLNSSGVIQWQNDIGSSGSEHFQSIWQTSDGGFICGGYSNSNIMGDKTENSHGSYDFWIIKLDSVGNIQWQNTLGGSTFEIHYNLRETLDGGYVCVGMTTSDISGEHSENIQGVRDYWVVKLDNTGAIQWQNTIGGSDIDEAMDVLPTLDGGIMVGGFSHSNASGDKFENCNGGPDFWLVKLTGKYNKIEGNEFADFNSNNVNDVGELPNPNKKVTEINTGRFAFTNTNGDYTLLVPDSGNFQIFPDPENFYSPSPTNYSVSFNGILQVDSLNDFAFQPTGVFNDLCVNLSPASQFRTGMSASYLISYTNHGTTSISPTIVFYPDADINYISSIPSATSVSPDSIVFSLPALQPFQNGQISIVVSVNLGLPIGTLINSGALILPIIGDDNPGCNQSYWEVLTTGAVDPNDILVNRDTLFDYELASPPWLEYLIRFQNTGNDTAFTVKVLNPIDTNSLNLASFEFVNSSHPVTISWTPWERSMEFVFDNIMLPDSNTNELLSHGFVRYRIQPKNSLVVGDSIQNFGAIYFDFNDPVITNTALTEIILFTSIKETHSSSLNVYPNPVTNEITLALKGVMGNEISIELSNMYGQMVMSLYAGNIMSEYWTRKFDISDLSTGVYILSVTGQKTTVQKIIKL